MKSETMTVEQIFQNRRQYRIPFYQRAYVWTLEDQWEQLWDDIKVKADARLSNGKITPHFMGAVVLEPQPREGLRGVENYHIIDGQQRFTTLQYVLTALLLVLRSTGNELLENTVIGCIKNGNQETMLDPTIEIFKIWPTFRDRDNFRAAMTALDLNELASRFPAHFTQTGDLRKIGIEHPSALAALWYFAHEFQKWISPSDELPSAIQAEALIVAILRDLKLVSITLDNDDDAQIIFETLNGRGAQLHATDLIRNYVFMRADRGQENSEVLYNNLWSAFESAYWSEEQRRGRIKKPRLDWLIQSALQAELHEEVDLSRLYHEYRKFATAGKPAITAEKQLLTLANYATHYKELVSGAGDTPIARFGLRIANYDVTTLYPLALMIATSSISDADKTEIYDDLVSYLVRRTVCGLTSKNYNNVFLSVLRQLYTAGINPTALRTILQASTGDASRWPDNSEFKNACLTAPLYPGCLDALKAKGMLAELERYLISRSYAEDKFVSGLSQLDVDHILPQSWYTYWPLPNGTMVSSSEASEVELTVRSGLLLNDRQGMIAKRQNCIKNLGNLTLLNLSVNRQAQHHTFTEKRNLLIAHTNLRLNIPLIARTAWDEDAIIERSQQLAEVALKLWPGPQ